MSDEIIWLFNLGFFAVGILCFLLGLVIGSFLNVCIWRLPREESIVWPNSHCTHCSSVLRFRDLVPVLSWLFLRGRCRFCGERISWRYPVVELLTGGLFLACYLHYGLRAELLAALVFSVFMVMISFIDLDHQIILDGMLIWLAVLGAAVQFWLGPFSWWSVLVGVVFGGGFLLLLAIISKGGMGGGDVKFAAALGFWLGWPGILLALFLSFMLGGLISLILLLTGLRGRKDFIPFGPFIAIGAWIVLLYGRSIVNWYLNLLG